MEMVSYYSELNPRPNLEEHKKRLFNGIRVSRDRRFIKVNKNLGARIRRNIPLALSQIANYELLVKPNFSSLGKVYDGGNKLSVIVSDEVENASALTLIDRQDMFKEIGDCNPEKFMKYVIAHEVGHLIEDKFSRGYATRYDHSRNSDLATSEGFAFWFGDIMSGLRTSERFMRNYGCDTDKLVRIYKTLMKETSDSSVKETIANWDKICSRVEFSPKQRYIPGLRS